MTTDFDDLIIGGGLGGCATAIPLARHGRTVAIVERSDYSRTDVGEAIGPALHAPLHALGLWDVFLAQNHLPSSGVVSIWGSAERHESSYLFHPFSSGWNIDRSQFCRMLATAAENSGSQLFCRSRVVAMNRCPVGWDVRIKTEHATLRLTAKTIVDASGHRSGVSRKLGMRREIQNSLAAAAFRVERPTDDPRLLVESTRNGWWYSAGLPNDKMVAVFLTDSDQLPPGHTNCIDHLARELSAAQSTLSRLSHCLPGSVPTVIRYNTGRLKNVAGSGWVAVGDAAATVDPLSGTGVIRALNSGIAASDALLQNDTAAYRTYVDRLWDDALAGHQGTYQIEHRWADRPFWRRRHTNVVT